MRSGWVRIFTSLSVFTASACAQSIKALTVILSVCNMAPATTPQKLNIIYQGYDVPKTPPSLNVNGLFRACSHDRANFTSDILATTIYIPCSGYLAPVCDVDHWSTFSDTYVKSLGMDTSNYSHHIYILPQNDPCGWGGLGSVGPCNKSCRVWVSGKVADKVAVFAHELAHNLGLGHAGYMGDSYGDISDMQGYCCNLRCWGAPHSDLLKWTVPLKTFSPPHNDVTEYTLQPNEYVRMHDEVRREDVWVQYRVGKAPYDKVPTNGVYVSSTQIPYYTSTLQMVLSVPGSSYDYFSTMRVVLKSIDKSRAVVLVQRVMVSATFMEAERLPI